MIFSEEQIRVYFDRIHYEGSRATVGETLQELQKAHLMNIPYIDSKSATESLYIIKKLVLAKNKIIKE